MADIHNDPTTVITQRLLDHIKLRPGETFQFRESAASGGALPEAANDSAKALYRATGLDTLANGAAVFTRLKAECGSVDFEVGADASTGLIEIKRDIVGRLADNTLQHLREHPTETFEFEIYKHQGQFTSILLPHNESAEDLEKKVFHGQNLSGAIESFGYQKAVHNIDKADFTAQVIAVGEKAILQFRKKPSISVNAEEVLLKTRVDTYTFKEEETSFGKMVTYVGSDPAVLEGIAKHPRIARMLYDTLNSKADELGYEMQSTTNPGPKIVMFLPKKT